MIEGGIGYALKGSFIDVGDTSSVTLSRVQMIDRKIVQDFIGELLARTEWPNG